MYFKSNISVSSIILGPCMRKPKEQEQSVVSCFCVFLVSYSFNFLLAVGVQRVSVAQLIPNTIL